MPVETASAPTAGLSSTNPSQGQPQSTPPLTPESTTQQQSTQQPPDPRVSQQFEALAKREKNIYRKMQEAKQLQAQLDARKDEIKRFEESRQNAKTNPLDYLKQGGLEYEDLVNFMLNDQKPTTEAILKGTREEIESLRKEQNEREEKRKLDAQKEAEEHNKQVISDYKEEIAEMLSKDPDKYEMTNLYGSVDDVYETVAEHWARSIEAFNKSTAPDKKTPKVLSKEEAADLVEQYYEGLYEKGTKTKRFQAKWAAAKSEEPVKPPTTPMGSPTTLTNHMNSAAGPSMLPAKTERDRIARALAALDKQKGL